jgi:hypothetical protein
MAAAIYLGNTNDLQKSADVFAGWLGDRCASASGLFLLFRLQAGQNVEVFEGGRISGNVTPGRNFLE